MSKFLLLENYLDSKPEPKFFQHQNTKNTKKQWIPDADMQHCSNPGFEYGSAMTENAGSGYALKPIRRIHNTG
jgi:hypothetical protein